MSKKLFFGRHPDFGGIWEILRMQHCNSVMISRTNYSIILIMEELRHPIDLPHCLSKSELDYFLDLISVTVDRIGEILVVVHAQTGLVAWLWDEELNQFCIGTIGTGI